MRVCIPTVDSAGAQSQLCDHFGSAPYFVIYDAEGQAFETVDNTNRAHQHGTCHPMQSLQGLAVDCIVCKGLGKRALDRLTNSGMRVVRTDAATVGEAIEHLSRGELEDIRPEDACRDHACHGS